MITKPHTPDELREILAMTPGEVSAVPLYVIAAASIGIFEELTRLNDRVEGYDDTGLLVRINGGGR